MDIYLNFSYTQEQIKNFVRFSIFPTKKSKKLFGLAFLAALLAGAILYFRPKKLEAIFLIKPLLYLVVVVWGVVLFCVTITYLFLPKRYFKIQPAFSGKYIINIKNEGLFVEHKVDTDTQKKFYSWNTFTQKAENKDMILLYEGRKKAWIFPKSEFLTKNELNEFRDFLDKVVRIPSKKIIREKIWEN